MSIIIIKTTRATKAKMEYGLAKFIVQPKYLFLLGGKILLSFLLK